MAKATPQAYRVVGSPLSYNGKTAQPDDVLNDIPGQSIAWLLEGGHIVATSDAVTGCSPRKFKTPTNMVNRQIASPQPAPEPVQPAPEPEPQPEPEPVAEEESAPTETEPTEGVEA